MSKNKIEKTCSICDEPISEFEHCCLECAETRIKSIKDTVQFFIEKNRGIKILLKIAIDIIKRSKDRAKEFDELLILLDKAIHETGGPDEDIL